jgi:hypothetical protein
MLNDGIPASNSHSPESAMSSVPSALRLVSSRAELLTDGACSMAFRSTKELDKTYFADGKG